MIGYHRDQLTTQIFDRRKEAYIEKVKTEMFAEKVCCSDKTFTPFTAACKTAAHTFVVVKYQT